MAKGRTGKGTISPPRGTRDLYPEDLLKRRYITQAWRDVSIRHGFDEIEGPTFERSELYAVKSGDGILGELFQAFSGKSPEELDDVKRTGRAPFALRPEFTPTLARMYAARAASLPTPTKWFTAGPYFRAERPQRGRLREFLQWNCDIMGADQESGGASFDASLIAPVVALMAELGLGPDSVQVAWCDRAVVAGALESSGVSGADLEEAIATLDKRNKLAAPEFERQMSEFGLDLERFDSITAAGGRAGLGDELRLRVGDVGWERWDPTIVRGLAYYTGTVFEVIADGERAVAGGGRYDDLVELFGGPSTPAVGFGMGDVVLSLLLADKGLMPEGDALMDAVSRAPASVRPEAFVIAEDERLDPVVTRTVARLRAGTESEAWRDRGGKPWDVDRYDARPMHARRSYKATRKRDKLMKEAMRSGAARIVVIESDEACTVRDPAAGREESARLDGLATALRAGR